MRTSEDSSSGRSAPGAGVPAVDIGLTPDPRAPGRAREALTALEEHLPPRVMDPLKLVVSELVTNSVKHAELRREGRIRLRVEPVPEGVRAVVTDPGPGFPDRPAEPSPSDDSGWGLFLVDRIADRWGVRGGQGAEVWVELSP